MQRAGVSRCLARSGGNVKRRIAIKSTVRRSSAREVSGLDGSIENNHPGHGGRLLAAWKPVGDHALLDAIRKAVGLDQSPIGRPDAVN